MIIKPMLTLAALLISAVVSVLAKLGHRQQGNDLSQFVGEWYVAGMSANLTNLWNNMTQASGFPCACPRFNMTQFTSGPVLRVESICDLQNATTSAIVGNATSSGIMVFERQIGDDGYLFIYSICKFFIAIVGPLFPSPNSFSTPSVRNGYSVSMMIIDNMTLSLENVPFNQTMDHGYTVQIQSRIIHVPPCTNGNCTSQGQPAGILSWSTSDPVDYKALMSSNATLNETGYNELVNAAGPEDAQGLVRLNTTCNNVNV
ncbi:hypothetical protein BX666DRAFT_1917054 [Dichotomocladium elegans]|nr:hypothetical protein BX666DRAFT_1917054 [Dichotomocladium elegans]